MLDWFLSNYIELFGVLSGLVYIYLEIKANIWLWPVGIITAAFYIIVFTQAKFYADMGLQVYYLIVFIYGLYIWMRKGKHSGSDKKVLEIRNISRKELIIYSISSIITYIIIYYILTSFTDSPLPAWDSFTTALSIIATFMLTQKIIEQWWIWIVVNIVSLGLYIYKDLYMTAFLFIVYGIMAVVGYLEWKKLQDAARSSNNS
jgi:nicotinamide mononucleotide transporter